MAKIGAIILAAGSGTRLNNGLPSETPKVLYEINGRPMVSYTLDLLNMVGIEEKVMVVGHKAEEVKKVFASQTKFALQEERKGTAHAAKIGEEKLSEEITHLLIIQGDDSAFYKKETFEKFLAEGEKFKTSFTTVKLKEPGSYGRIIRNERNEVEKIVEKEALNEEQKEIKEVNAAVYLLERNWFNFLYPKLSPSKVGKGELIMPDFIELTVQQGEKVLGFEIDETEWVGVNTKEELERANLLMKQKEIGRKVHFMGIGGAGLSAISAFAFNLGWQVSGCDLDQNSPFLNNLKKEGIKIFSEHNQNHCEDIDFLVISPAIESLDPDNHELKWAKRTGVKVMIGEEFLAKYLVEGKKVVAVTGTHGKSTTTAMVGEILENAQLDPSVMVGALVNNWEKNYRFGKGDYFVIEGDEYQEKFLFYKPYLSIITVVEMDHPEYFKDFEAVKDAFEKFADRTEKYLILGEKVELKLQNSKVEILKLGKDFQKEKFSLRLIGEFNQDNANLAFEAASVLGIEKEISRKALESFNGVARRFEFKGEEKGVKVFEDYAHHPTAIGATEKAVSEKFPGSKIWIVYQPHLYTRTFKLKKEFIQTFKNSNAEIILTDIYAAREENRYGISSLQLVKEINKENVRYLGDFENIAFYLAKNTSANDLVIIMGAGDIYKLTEIVLKKLENMA